MRVEDAHEPIIDRERFDTVQTLLGQDTRVAAGKSAVYPFCGLIICGDCGYNMVRRSVNRGKKKFYYFTCSGHRDGKAICNSHLINVDACELAVLHSLRSQIAAVLDMERAISGIHSLPYQQVGIRKIEAQIEKIREEIQRCENLRFHLHEDYSTGLLNREIFLSFQANYNKKIQEAEAAILLQQEEIERLAAGNTENCAWIKTFKAHRNIDAIDRKTAVELIESIYIYKDKRIAITFRYQNEFDRLLKLLRCEEAV